MIEAWWLEHQQTQVIWLEHLLESYLAQLADSHAQGLGDAALLTRQILEVRLHLQMRRAMPAPSHLPRPSAWTDTGGPRYRQRVVECLMAYHQTQIDRLRQRIAQKEAELAISQEQGLADCSLLSQEITSLQAALERSLQDERLTI